MAHREHQSVRHEVWLALLLLPLLRTDLRVSVDRWSWLATPACWAEPYAGRLISLREDLSLLNLPHVNTRLASADDVIPICVGDELGAGRPACDLLLGLALQKP